MTTVYKAIKQYEEVRGNMIERLSNMGLIEIFQPLIEEHGGDMDLFNDCLFYLINCYSRESEIHIQYTDWGLVQREAAIKATIDIDGPLFQTLSTLNNLNFARTVRRYLDYQNSKVFKHLIMLKDLYEQMVNAAVEYIKDGDEVVNYDQKFKNSEHAEKLYEKINQWEQRIEQDNVLLTKGIEQLKAVEKKDSHTLRLEDNLENS